MIYIYIIKYEGNVWEGEPTVWDNELTIWLTVGNSELEGKYHVKVKQTLYISKKKLVLFPLIPFLPPK